MSYEMKWGEKGYKEQKMKLKTLKDLDFDIPTFKDRLVGVTQLRKEAIKWVKRRVITEKGWKEFFNITEEDLQ